MCSTKSHGTLDSTNNTLDDNGLAGGFARLGMACGRGMSEAGLQ
jgi:hypothetical protein